MTLIIDIPDEVADRARSTATARGMDLSAFAAAAMIAEIDAESEGPDTEVVAAAFESIEDARVDRLYTMEDLDNHMEAALASARQRRDQSASLVIA